MDDKVVQVCRWMAPTDSVPADGTNQLMCGYIENDDGDKFVYPTDFPDDLTIAEQSDWFFSKLEDARIDLKEKSDPSITNKIESQIEKLLKFFEDLALDFVLIVSIFLGIVVVLEILI